MKITLNSKVAMLSLVLCLTASSAFTMQDSGGDSSDQSSVFNLRSSSPVPKCGERTTSSPSGDLIVDELRDAFKDSVSLSMFAHSNIKDQIQINLSKLTGHSDTRRILQLDGGGVRGLFSILELCVLEEIINLPSEAKFKLLAQKEKRIQESGRKDDLTRLYIRDLFDVGTGTSTGSILTAGLFSMTNLSAIEVAQLYTRFGCKIFDEHRRLALPGINIGLISATYGNEGLSQLLADYFSNATLQDVHKPIYIVALNESKQEAAVFSTNKMHGDLDELHKTPLREAVLASSSAPTFLPGINGVTKNGLAFLSDGGTVANNSAHLVYKKEIITHQNPYEIYSFGTGTTPPPDVRSVDSGALSVAKILENTLVASEKLAFTNCVDEINAVNSQLQYFVRINPRLDPGMNKLDDTSQAYVQYAIQKAFSVTLGPVFADMVARLGFSIPEAQSLKIIHSTIQHKLGALSSVKYDGLSKKYEKEFVLKKVKDLDTRFLRSLYVIDPATQELKQMSKVENEQFKGDLIKAAEADIKAHGETWSGMIWSADGEFVKEIIQRSDAFHDLMENVEKCPMDQFRLLIADEKQPLFTKEQVAKLNDMASKEAPGLTARVRSAIINNVPQLNATNATIGMLTLFNPLAGAAAVVGKALNRSYSQTSSYGEQSPQNIMAFNILQKFIECCETGQEFNYMAYNSPYMNLPSLIFWTNYLSGIKDQLSLADINKFRENFTRYINHISTEHSTSLRFNALLEGLDLYIAKNHFPEEIL